MNDAAQLFKALGDPTRLQLVLALSAGELNVSELVDVLGMSQPRISRHLAQLRQTGIVEVRYEGTASYHRLAEHGPLRAAVALVDGAGEDAAEIPASWRENRDALRLRGREIIANRARASHAFFDNVDAAAFEASRLGLGNSLERRALEALLPRGLRLADIGTGTGVMLPDLARSAREVVAIDRSEAMLDAARARVESLGIDNVDFRRGDLDALPLEARDVDGALLNMVLHHAPEPESALRELARVVRPDGRIVVIDLCTHKAQWLVEEQADLWMGFEPDVVAQWCRKAGIEAVEIERSVLSTERGDLASFILRGVRRQFLNQPTVHGPPTE